MNQLTIAEGSWLNIINPKPRIILVDDNRDILSILAGNLALKGYEVYKAHSAEECLNKIKELDDTVDFVFIDGKIAADRGAALIIKVKKINQSFKIVVLAEEKTDETRVLDYGAEEFITKPISAETIVDKVNSLLIKKEARAF